MGDIDFAVQLAVQIAKDDSHGYDQQNRNGPDYDCSSLISTVLYKAGFKISPNSWTGNMRSQLLAEGFKECSYPWQAGDIHLNDANHVAMSVNQFQIVEASINEKGDITGGQTGDQTGNEIHIRTYFDYPWNIHLRINYGVIKNSPITGIEDIARACIRGDYGNNPERSARLQSEGYDPVEVQEKINELLNRSVDYVKVELGDIARQVIRGEFGNEPERSKKLISMGLEPKEVQKLVNQILGVE